MVEDDFQIIEPGETYEGKPTEGFSHASLVMTAFRKVIENGSKEMREGYWNNKFDRMGNAHRVWIPDSRQEFKESVNTLKMVVSRDFDDDANEKLKVIDEELEKKYKLFCKLEENDWKKSPSALKDNWRKEGSYFREGFLSKSLPYVFEYIEEEVKAARKVVNVIACLIKRLYDYEEVSYAA